ncbi:protein MAIN-LIKE 1-like [Chenopodium quinoa]|uniref:protein MAIN-LIKE 1-like n=1 Tax=Chenopodium quinoa TaxID=63459 RepID=UPI000B79439A|nr:protein MAIN-LIKE 1-like [Chenopodium quinoa]
MPLISAFVERWHPETNSFHLPFGELTITLHDVAYILSIPITGQAVFGKPVVSQLKEHLKTTLNISTSEVDNEYRRGSVRLNFIQGCCSSNNLHSSSEAIGYLLWLLGCTIFVDRSSTSVSPYLLPYLVDLEKVKDYAWGAACLTYMYRQLGVASRFDNAQIAGCLTLLQTHTR